MKSKLTALWLVVAREIDADVATLALALTLVALGFWNFWKPGAFLIPGLALLWMTLPSRRPFVDRPDKTEGPARRKR